MDLFRELSRHYPLAKLRSYYQHGRWLKLQLVTDATLIIAHRAEGGAPPPLDLQDVPTPELPREAARSSVSHRGARPPARSSTDAGVSTRALAPLPPKPPREAPSSRVAAAPQGADQRSGAGEAQVIASFISRWRLNATRTKLMLSRLLPSKRSWVLDHFRGARASGATTEDDLRQYIARCERENVWASSRAIGTKRAASPAANEPSKRPRSDVVGARISRPPLRDPPPPTRPSPRDWPRHPPSSVFQRSTNGSSVTSTRSTAEQRSYRAPAIGAIRSSSASTAARATTPISARTTASTTARNVTRYAIGTATSTAARKASFPTSPPSSTVVKRAPSSAHKPKDLTKPEDRPGDLIKHLLGNVV